VIAIAIRQSYVNRNHTSMTRSTEEGRTLGSAPLSLSGDSGVLLRQKEVGEVLNRVVLVGDECFNVVVCNAVVVLHRW